MLLVGSIRPQYRLNHGLRMPLGFPPASLTSALAYAPADGDIFVASYPKSGTTWLQYIVYLLIRRRPIGPDESLTDLFPHLEESGATAVEAMRSPRLIKTHLARDLAPFSSMARYLVIARNPFDCAVSFFHHTRGFPQHYGFAEGTFSEFFDCFLAGEVDFGDYFDHLVSWLKAADESNVLFLTYESLLRATARTIGEVATFLGEGASEGIDSDAALERLIDEAGLSSMRRNQQRWSSRRPGWAPAFVRKGGVGDWRSLFSPRQTRALLAKFDQRLANTGTGTLWPDVLDEAREYARAAGEE